MPASDSSSDEYHDCESPSKLHIKRSSKDIPFEFPAPDSTKKPKEDAFQIQRPKEENDKEQVQRRDDFNFVEPKSTHRQRFKDLKKDLLNNDDDGEDAINDSENPSNSSSKSIDAASKNTVQSSHPFRVIDNDAMSIHSMTSLGRVGRILSGSLDPSSVSVGRDSNQLHMAIQQQQQQQQHQQQHDSTSLGNSNSSSNATITQTLTNRTRDSDNQSLNSDNTEYSFTMHRPTILQEPDVIASTKLAHSKTTDSITAAGPVAPPRLRRNKDKSRKVSTSSTDQLTNFNEGLNFPKLNRFSDSQQITTTTTSSSSLASMATTTTTTDSNAGFISKSGESVDKILPSPATLYAITKEIENSFKETTNSTTFEPSAPPTVSHGSPSTSSISRSTFTGSLNKISSYSFHGQSPPQPYYKSSPSNSVKSNSAPGRVTSMDPNLTLSINKVTQGHFVVKPQDDLLTRAEGPKTSTQNLCDVRKKSTATLEDIERLQRIRSEILESTSGDRFKLAGVGSNSLGNDTRYSENRESDKSAMKERRKSAGDEEILKQLNVYVRTRTDSGQIMSDHEILEQVPVKNLDTGENFPLSAADEKLEQCINPLSLYIMHLTSHIRESDEESVGGMTVNSELPPGEEEDIEIEEGGRLRRKTQKIKRFLATTAKKAKNTAKSIASEVSHARHKEDIAEIVDVMNPEQNIKIKASKTNTGPYEFAKLQHVQDLSVQGETTGAVWCMKFSPCGRLLATAGQDRLLRIWVLKDAYHFFEELIKKYNADQKSSPTPSQESLVSHHSFEESAHILQAAASTTGPFVPVPYRTYSGHTSDLLDVSWSKSHFILSSSMDKTVRLWHISRKECLCCFQHIEFVTAIAFHPLDDSFFLSGSLDGKLRLWNIPNKKVFLWNEVDGRRQLITAANFCQNGKFAVVGTYDGRCLFYNTEQLKYHTQIHVRSTRGKNATGRKITGIEPMPGEDKILVTSNDSRIRLYDLRDLNLSCKYKGYLNDSQQIKASFSHDGKYIISGSENQSIYIWKTHHDYAKLSSVRRDRSDFWEGIKAHNATVTCAIFSPHPETIIKPESDSEISSDKASHSSQPADPLVEQRTKGCGGHVLVSVDFTGCIKVFLNKTKPKHSSLPYTAILD